MERILQKIDFVLVIRLIAGVLFVWTGWEFKDWTPAIFGFAWIGVGIYASITQTGCGYNGSCGVPMSPRRPARGATNADEVEFTEL